MSDESSGERVNSSFELSPERGKLLSPKQPERKPISALLPEQLWTDDNGTTWVHDVNGEWVDLEKYEQLLGESNELDREFAAAQRGKTHMTIQMTVETETAEERSRKRARRDGKLEKSEKPPLTEAQRQRKRALKCIKASLYIAGLPHDCTEAEVDALCAETAARVQGMVLLRLPDGTPSGEALVRFDSRAKRDDLVSKLNGATLRGHRIQVGKADKSFAEHTKDYVPSARSRLAGSPATSEQRTEERRTDDAEERMSPDEERPESPDAPSSELLLSPRMRAMLDPKKEDWGGLMDTGFLDAIENSDDSSSE